jgi:hypothetical protein
VIRRTTIALLAYPACWAVAHVSVMLTRGDGPALEYLVPYFKLAWSFSAGELPSFIWLFSLVLWAGAMGTWLAVVRRRRQGAA